MGRFRGERPPKEGYVLQGGDWVRRSEVENAEREARVAKWAARLTKAEGAERDALVDDLLGEGASTEVAAVVEKAWAVTLERLAKDRGVKRLEKVAEVRRELDARRSEALELIFDEEQYFYPYRPPECPPEKAKDYPEVQRRVSALVRAVQEVWEDPTAVEVGDGLRRLLDEVDWCRAMEAELALTLDAGGLPEWFGGLDPSLEEITVHNFAWDADERDALAYSRAVVAFNQGAWREDAAPAPDEGRVAGDMEREQVEVTNRYRAMMGRRALAWNARIQWAAHDHSDYMARTGDFGHFEPNPETRSPGDRMMRRGYMAPASENCHAGSGGAVGAHESWLRSSGHHRNILQEGHREMASAVEGRYWTQNFGTGRDFEPELIGWRD